MNIPAKRRGARAVLHLGQPNDREYFWQTTPAQQTMITLIIQIIHVHYILVNVPGT